MNAYLLLSLLMLCTAGGFAYGYLFGRDTERSYDRAWASGFAAGVQKAETLGRWEMR